jgi:YaiO family outer membrane protein
VTLRALATLLARAYLVAAASSAAAQDGAARDIGGAAGRDGGPAAAIEQGDLERAAALLRAELERSSEDQDARFALARVLGRSGDYAGALAEYDALVAAHADNVDYSLGRAQVLAWSNRDREALDEIARARALAPSYEAVWELELALLERGEGTQARLAALRDEAARRFPASDWWADGPPPAQAEPMTELAIGAAHQSLSRPVPDWSTLSLRITRRRGSGSAYYGALERERRFARDDFAVGAGGSFSPAEQWTAGVDLALGADSDFAPDVSATGWAARAYRSGWETRFTLRQRRYETAKVTSAAATGARYFGKFRAAYTLDRSRLHGETASTAHSAALNYYYSEHTQLDLTIAAGQEAEAIAPGVVLETDVRAYSLGARHALSERWRLSWWVGSHRQGELYRRRYVGFDLAVRL